MEKKTVRKIMRGIQSALAFATVVLFIGWLLVDLSGWYWFWAAISGFIISEL
jgi:hypothetical protein